MTVLLDANVLIALLVADHVHHDAAEAWLADTVGCFATCPITEGNLVRLLIREGQSAETTRAVISAVAGDPATNSGRMICRTAMCQWLASSAIGR